MEQSFWNTDYYRAVLAGVLGLMVWILGNFVLNLWQHDVPDQLPPPRLNQPQDWHNIGQYHLLGESDALLDSSSTYTLKGISLSIPKGHSRVIIEPEAGEARVLGEGDSLPDGTKIEKITADSVILWHKGKRERLSLPKDE